MTDYRLLIIAITALALAVIALLLAIFFYLKIRSMLYCRGRYNNHRLDNIRDIVVEVVCDSDRIRNFINGIYRENIAQSRNIHINNNQVRTEPGISTEIFNDIVDVVLNKIQKQYRVSQNNSDYNHTLGSTPKTMGIQEMYASSFNGDTNTFYEISKQPSDQSIFVISIDPHNSSRGTFEVYHDAYDKVIDCKDFLEYCCEVTGTGTNIETMQYGEVELSSGKWIVTTKLKIKFV